MKKTNFYIFLVAIFFTSCSENSFFPSSNNADSSAGSSKGGSTAKFAIKENILYIVEKENLSVFDISNLKNS